MKLEPEYSELAKLLKTWRFANGYTQAQASKILNVPKSAIGHLETMKDRTSYHRAIRILTAMGYWGKKGVL